MNALIHAELLKLRSTRMVAGLLLAMAALVVVTVLTTVPNVGATDLRYGSTIQHCSRAPSVPASAWPPS